jgi:SET domain-containing protein
MPMPIAATFTIDLRLPPASCRQELFRYSTFMNAALHIRQTADRGRGLFATEPIAKGSRLLEMRGQVFAEADLPEEGMAMQVGDDLWLYSTGDQLDDCGNHSCDPNAGFITGLPVLHALRDIAAGEEVCWDYSTSIGYAGWVLACRCGSATCRGMVRSWGELAPADRERLRTFALAYLRQK